MVKRELLIVAGFGIAGLVTYQLTAPPPAAGARSFTLSSLVAHWRDSGNRANSSAKVETQGSIPSPKFDEIRISSVAHITVIGEDRPDVTWTLSVDASGATEVAAREAAERVVLATDDLGDVLTLSTRPPRNLRHTSTLTLRVPARLSLRVEHARRSVFENVRALRLENLVGDVDAKSITGEVTGSHRNGGLRITDAGGVRLTLVGVKSVITGTRGETVMTARNGESRLSQVRGPVVLDVNNEAVSISDALAPVRVNATAGSVNVERPRQSVHIDARRTRVSLWLDTAVAATVLTAEAPLTLQLTGVVPITIDAAVTDGTITAADVGAKVETTERETRTHHIIGGTARVSLRNERSEIVIAQRK